MTTVARALEYKAALEAIEPDVEFLMTLYLSPELTPEEIHKAKDAGIVGACAPHARAPHDAHTHCARQASSRTRAA